MAESLRCFDCGVKAWDVGEDFYVKGSLWRSTIPKKKQDRIICIRWFEIRLRRKLVKNDFKRWFWNNRCWGDRRRKLNILYQTGDKGCKTAFPMGSGTWKLDRFPGTIQLRDQDSSGERP